MKKLNKRKIRWIVKEFEKRDMGVYTIDKQQNITHNIQEEFIRNIKEYLE